MMTSVDLERGDVIFRLPSIHSGGERVVIRRIRGLGASPALSRTHPHTPPVYLGNLESSVFLLPGKMSAPGHLILIAW